MVDGVIAAAGQIDNGAKAQIAIGARRRRQRRGAAHEIVDQALSQSHLAHLKSLHLGPFQYPIQADQSRGQIFRPERIEIEFDVRIAQDIRSRDWHPTQRLRTDVDGSVRLTLDVRPDQTLRSWILSFGPRARVVSPARLAEQILEELDETREKYAPRMDFDLPIVLLEELDAQRTLPFTRAISGDSESGHGRSGHRAI